MLVYFGTYTGAKSQGIYQAPFDPATGRLGTPELAGRATSPSYLALHPNHRYLYAVSEVASGVVYAFAIDEKTGKLTLLNQQPSGGSGPCYLAVDSTGKCLVVANYNNGSIAALPIKADGSLAEPSTTIQHQGSSINRSRQAGPHGHFITTDPANRFALACDLGLDKVLVYRLDAAKGALTTNDPPSVSLKPGAGPRHLAFGADGRFVYVIAEMGSTITTMTYDASRGALQEIQSVSTLPEGFQGTSTCAEVQVHPTGKFVYVSNRGHNSIAVFAVDPATGKLTQVECQPTQGKTPRHFALDPSGKWLLAENQDSDTIVAFGVDAKTGRLTPTGQTVSLGAPVCAVFWPGSK